MVDEKELLSSPDAEGLTAFRDKPDGREGSSACGAIGIGIGAVLSSIPEG